MFSSGKYPSRPVSAEYKSSTCISQFNDFSKAICMWFLLIVIVFKRENCCFFDGYFLYFYFLSESIIFFMLSPKKVIFDGENTFLSSHSQLSAAPSSFYSGWKHSCTMYTFAIFRFLLKFFFSSYEVLYPCHKWDFVQMFKGTPIGARNVWP